MAKASWWPLHHTWMGSDFNSGYWMDRCEDWFQKRLAEIEAGTAQPIPVNGWRNQLRINATTRAFHALAEHVASDSIE
jgi:hypothetical protein